MSSGRDEHQIYDSSSKAVTSTKANDLKEVYFSKLSILWKEIDRRMSNPMVCSDDTTTFNKFIQRQILYLFVTGINEDLDKERRDALHIDLPPTINVAYDTI